MFEEERARQIIYLSNTLAITVRTNAASFQLLQVRQGKSSIYIFWFCCGTVVGVGKSISQPLGHCKWHRMLAVWGS